jgi:hypothetical protein
LAESPAIVAVFGRDNAYLIIPESVGTILSYKRSCIVDEEIANFLFPNGPDRPSYMRPVGEIKASIRVRPGRAVKKKDMLSH